MAEAAGAATASFFWIVWVLVDFPSSAAKSLGGEAEIWTSNGLRRLRRAGWTVIDHVPFEERDVDHVLVGPSGVIAVESKYASGPWQIVGGELRGPVGDPLSQAREGARKIWRRATTAAGLDGFQVRNLRHTGAT